MNEWIVHLTQEAKLGKICISILSRESRGREPALRTLETPYKKELGTVSCGAYSKFSVAT